jgi:hypothetical protein
MAIKTLILKENIDKQKLHEKLTDLDYETHETPSDETMKRILWISKDSKTAVNYIEDKMVNIVYFLLRGKSIKSMAKILSSNFPVWKRDDLLKYALLKLENGTQEEIAQVAMEISAEMDEYDAASAGVLTTFLQMDQQSTRIAGARALRVRPWMIFYDTAEELSEDYNPEIAAIGKEMLDRIIELNDL